MSRRHSKKKILSEAQQAIRTRIEQCESIVELVAIGNEYIETEPVQAARAYRKALLKQHNDGVVINNLGVAYWNMGNHGEALKEFEKAKRLLPDDANVVNNFASALLNSGQQDKARHWFKKAAGLTPAKHTFLAYIDLHGY